MKRVSGHTVETDSGLAHGKMFVVAALGSFVHLLLTDFMCFIIGKDNNGTFTCDVFPPFTFYSVALKFISVWI